VTSPLSVLGDSGRLATASFPPFYGGSALSAVSEAVIGDIGRTAVAYDGGYCIYLFSMTQKRRWKSVEKRLVPTLCRGRFNACRNAAQHLRQRLCPAF
jgi:hypothetical protein